jgi:hypothetical protein
MSAQLRPHSRLLGKQAKNCFFVFSQQIKHRKFCVYFTPMYLAKPWVSSTSKPSPAPVTKFEWQTVQHGMTEQIETAMTATAAKSAPLYSSFIGPASLARGLTRRLRLEAPL